MSDMSQTPVELGAAAVGPTEAPRKPRMAIMGEFSAGKSTLSNLLLGAKPLPEKVTATRLSPVWLTKGNAPPVAHFVDAERAPEPVTGFDGLDVDAVRYVSMSIDSTILEYCDLIDFPGISDPNMDSDVWERMLPEIDLILWLTHATQAWRQSEAAAWDLVPEEVQARSMLLVTRFDKLTTERDQKRVLARLHAETEDLFAGIYPLSLLDALNAAKAGDADAWDASGARRFTQDLHIALARLDSSIPEPGAEAAPAPAPEAEPQTARRPSRRIVPRRIRAALGGGRRSRPQD
ncbi:dynamin family protein [Jannaschia seohaensis]|uniref:50S ribosome-binding GTPase n=1 Tax=Jannaschia seohaensis TaxID=475081 RepID=A0A2Y9C912_9RHOB|nr:dynamin family protein [Jannaschia seohaensis]PWJ12502.1 50S ribosome-binding GTPase [Jannaschia seohaensis]SSA50983.1 Dynamin family protein [Jannaschia seohaensis]